MLGARTLIPSDVQMMAPYAARAMMYALGYFWIDTWGQPAPAQEAPLLVSNHVSIMDAVYFVYGNFPCGFVSRKVRRRCTALWQPCAADVRCRCITVQENLKIPMVGQIMLAMQGIFVDRASSTSRYVPRPALGSALVAASSHAAARAACCSKDTMDAITNRAHSIMRGERPSWPQARIFVCLRRNHSCNALTCSGTLPPLRSQVLIFPEGTTTNGSAIMSFKTGGFRPGVPVQPAVVRARGSAARCPRCPFCAHCAAAHDRCGTHRGQWTPRTSTAGPRCPASCTCSCASL